MCGCCPCTEGQRNGNLLCVGGCYKTDSVDASDAPGIPVSDALPTYDGNADAAVCSSISSNYAAALQLAQECTVAAANQCALQVRSGFFCNCTTFANSGAATLSAIVTQYQDSGCRNTCTGTCGTARAASCMVDTTSSLGGRCQPANLLNLTATQTGGTFSVAVGDEIDITLESPAPGSYNTTMSLSSTAATILEVTIPAGPTNTNGPTRLYRLHAASAGTAKIGISFEPSGSGAARPSYTATINIH